MNTNKKWIHILTIAYVYIPIIIFLLGWCKLIWAIPTLIGIIFTTTKLINDKDFEEGGHDIIISPMILSIALLFIFAMLTFMGMSGIFPQTGDHYKHNSVLEDLSTHTFPVYYTKAETSMLTYYIGHYLVPSIFGKIFGNFKIANIAMTIWSMLGLTLCFIHLIRVIEAKHWKKQLLALGMMFFFSGALPLCHAVLECIPGITITLPNSTHWVATTNCDLQYRSNLVMLRWAFPQVIVPWIATLLLFERRKSVKYYCFLLIPVALFGTFPFASLALVALLLAMVNLFKKKICIRDIFSRYNIISIITLGLIIAIYLWGNVSAEKPSICSFRIQNYPGRHILTYLCFIFFMFGIQAFCIFKKYKKDTLYYITVILLMIIPFFRMGYFNDFVMSSSIPLLFILMVMVLKFLFDSDSSFAFMKGILITLLCIGMIYPSAELVLNIKDGNQEDNLTNMTYSLEKYSDRANDNFREDNRYNYFTYDLEEQIFYKYIARKRIQ